MSGRPENAPAGENDEKPAADKKKKRDVLMLDAYEMDSGEEEQSGCFGAGGCGSCGCG